MNNATANAFNPDWDDVNPAAQEEMPLSFPIVFWRHGSLTLKQLGENNFNYTGGLFFGYGDVGEDTKIEGWSDCAFTGEDGSEVKGLGARAAHLAIVRYRRRWFKDAETGTEYRAWNDYARGFRAHIQCVAFIRGYENPVCISMKGIAVNYLYSILREQNSKVLAVANREAPQGKKLPVYAFWLTIKAGKHDKAGQQQGKQSDVTMPQIVLPKAVDPEYLNSRYIGKDNLKRFQDLWFEAEKWAHEWDVPLIGGESAVESRRPEPANGNGAEAKRLAHKAQAPPDDPYEGATFRDDAPPPNDDIPF